MSFDDGAFGRGIDGLVAGGVGTEFLLGASAVAAASGPPRDEMMAAMCEGVGEASLRLEELEELALVLDGGHGACRPPPRTIECYDVSHLYGSYTVAASSAATCGVLDLDRYGYYPLGPDCGVTPADDCAALRAALRLRFGRDPAGGGVDAGAGAAGGGGTCADALDVPDLILIDGGKPQLGAAIAVLDEVSGRAPGRGWGDGIRGGRGLDVLGSSDGCRHASGIARAPTVMAPSCVE
jgi:hypothetical protein